MLKQKENRILYLYCLGLAALFLAICSKSSFLYPLNDWYDANGFLTVGKGVLDGLVPYRDLYEQKGPLLYFLHSICALVPGTHFLGVYFLETVCLSVFLYFAGRLLSLYAPGGAAYFLLPILAALLLSSESFCQGDSAEELCAPAVMILLYYSIRRFAPGGQRGQGFFSYRFLLVQGVLAGCVFWMKYTLLGLHFAFMAFLFFWLLAQRQYTRAGKSCLAFLLGMLIPSAGILAYFAFHGALGDLWQVYFYNNIFLYDSGQAAGLFSRLLTILLRIGDTFLRNLQFSLLTVVGVLAFLGSRLLSGRAGKILLALEAVFLASLIYTGSNFPYYGYILCVFPVLGLAALAAFGRFVWHTFHRIPRPGELLRALAPFLPFGFGLLVRAFDSYARQRSQDPEREREKPASVPLPAPMLWFYRSLAVLVCLFFAFYKSPNTSMLGAPREELAQFQFQELLSQDKDPTLLNYGFLDGGFYTVCEVLPTCKYFQMQNISQDALPEMMDSQNAVIREQAVDYVVVRGEEIPSLVLDYYEPVAEARQLYEGAHVRYVLLARRETAGASR